MELQGCCRLSYRLKCKLDIVTCAFLRFILLLYSSSPSFWNLLRTVSGGLWWPHQQLPSYSSLDGLAPLRIFCLVFKVIIKRVLSDVSPFIKQDITNFLFWNEVCTRRHRWIGSSSFALSSTSSSIVYFPLDKISILIDKPSDLWIRPDNDNFPFPYIRLAAWLEMFKHTRPGRIVGQGKYNLFDRQISIFETPYCFLWGCRFPGSSNKSCPWWSRLRTPWRLWAVPLTSMAKPELYQISWTALFMDFCNNTSVFLQLLVAFLQHIPVRTRGPNRPSLMQKRYVTNKGPKPTF